MGLCFTQEKKTKQKKFGLLTVRPLGVGGGPRWGPAPGVAEWQGSVVTAFLGEVVFYFFFGNSPKNGILEVVKG